MARCSCQALSASRPRNPRHLDPGPNHPQLLTRAMPLDRPRCAGCLEGARLRRPRSRLRRCLVTRLSLFNSPLLLGFDQLERALDQVSKTTADGYPPYNVEQVGESALRITLAVAGFTMADLEVQIEGNQLV